MSLSLTYPGVYIQELDSDVRTITGVATSITAFLGRALRGPVNEPTRVLSFADYDRIFGGLWADSMMSFSVRHFFLNGGSDALIVRVHNPSAVGEADVAVANLAAEGGGNPLSVLAANPGEWGNNLRVIVDHETRDKTAANPVLFNLFIEERSPVPPNAIVATEQHRNLSLDPNSSRFVTQVLAQESNLLRVDTTAPFPANRPDDAAPFTQLAGGDNGQAIGDNQLVDPNLQNDKEGLWALERIDLFNLLCIPPFSDADEVAPATWDIAADYCEDRRAMLIIDPDAAWDDARDVTDANILAHVVTRRPNAALYFPRIRAANPLKENRLETFAPSGAIAGVIARTDATRGVWKAPAGQEATLGGVQELAVPMTDGENGLINPLGVNALRSFRVAGRVVWGARTLAGADELGSQWKYIPVRRLALFIEESLYRGTQWVVFEPNDEPLWSQIRLNLGAFMHDLFRQGAFQGTTPREAYFVKCDRETTTQNDIDRGIVNIIVGFAPLKPAEFVVIKIQQIAGQLET